MPRTQVPWEDTRRAEEDGECFFIQFFAEGAKFPTQAVEVDLADVVEWTVFPGWFAFAFSLITLPCCLHEKVDPAVEIAPTAIGSGGRTKIFQLEFDVSSIRGNVTTIVVKRNGGGSSRRYHHGLSLF